MKLEDESGNSLAKDEAQKKEIDDRAPTNQVIRSDFELQKNDEDCSPLAGTLFSIRAASTGEEHFFFTGPEGTYNSASNYISRVGNEVSMDVNAVDELIPQNADKTIKTVKLENGKTKFTSGKENVDAWQDVGQ